MRQYGPSFRSTTQRYLAMNSTSKVQAYRQRQKEKGRNQRTLYATDAEFRAIKALLKELRKGK